MGRVSAALAVASVVLLASALLADVADATRCKACKEDLCAPGTKQCTPHGPCMKCCHDGCCGSGKNDDLLGTGFYFQNVELDHTSPQLIKRIQA
ncbi:hypothetical protein CBR_g17562 [Chara braunii]|uniref:Bowman-Birk serine protease inhibitors family domain-containing protein n=1 Tax=Chara braunii TaxID=69332 RepID=A0A388KUX1_CHABU|nr:hypothetical protein CBR_g17562 [Chara braunii]|eukprot:GBG73851.1 hypothetical protein CBR_g17562 [Chara braunii]